MVKCVPKPFAKGLLTLRACKTTRLLCAFGNEARKGDAEGYCCRLNLDFRLEKMFHVFSSLLLPRSFGASNYSKAATKNAVQQMEPLSLRLPSALSPPYNLISSNALKLFRHGQIPQGLHLQHILSDFESTTLPAAFDISFRRSEHTVSFGPIDADSETHKDKVLKYGK